MGDNFTEKRRRMYDNTAGLYAATFPLIWRYAYRKVHRVLSEELNGCQTILDAGTGTGYWADYLARQDNRKSVIALDFSQTYLQLALNAVREESVSLLQGDINRMPLACNTLDAILCSGVLDTFPDVEPAIAEFARLLPEEGKLLLIIRGEKQWLSRAAEWSFRAGVALSHMLSERSLKPKSVSDELWNREALINKIEPLCNKFGFRLENRVSFPIITLFVFKRIDNGGI